MRYQRQCNFIYFPSSFRLSGLRFFEQCIIQPQVDITFPISFFKHGRLVSYGPLVYLPGSLNIPSLLFEPSVIEPCIIIKRFLLSISLQLMSSSHHYDLFHFLASAILFLKFQILRVKPLTSVLWDVIESIFVKDLCSIMLLVLQLKLCELDEEILIKCLRT